MVRDTGIDFVARPTSTMLAPLKLQHLTTKTPRTRIVYPAVVACRALRRVCVREDVRRFPSLSAEINAFSASATWLPF